MKTFKKYIKYREALSLDASPTDGIKDLEELTKLVVDKYPNELISFLEQLSHKDHKIKRALESIKTQRSSNVDGNPPLKQPEVDVIAPNYATTAGDSSGDLPN